MEREASDIRRSSSGGAGEPSSSSAASSSEKHRCSICNNEFRTPKGLCGHMRIHPTSSRGVKPAHTHQAEQQQQGCCDVRASAAAEEQQGCCDVRGSAAAEESIIPVRELEEDVNLRRWESVVNQLLLLVEKSPQWPQGDDGGSSQNNNFITSHNSTTARGSGDGGGGNGEVIMKDGFNEPENISIVAAGAGMAVDAAIIAVHNNGTVLSDAKKKGSSSSAAGGGGAHTCEKCGRTFATGQSLGGHMRKHYDGPVIIANKKRTREQQPEETPAAPTVERRVHEPAVPTAPLESHNPVPLSLSVQASAGGDCERNREEERESSSAGNGARRLLDLDLNKLAEPEEEEEEEPKNAPQQEPERRDDDEFLSLRLGQFDIGKSSGV